MIKNLLLVILSLIFASVEIKAQYLASFAALQHGNNIELNIVIAGGNTCNGITILRSTDAVLFSPIGDIAGICGSSTEDVFYSFTDFAPVPNAINYYRLDLITLGYTSIINIHFVFFGANEILLYPNPITESASVYLQTTNADLSSFRINDRSGRLLKQVDGIRGNFFELNREDWPTGLYYLEVQTGARNSIVKPFLIE